MPEPDVCAQPECFRQAFTGGICAEHYVTRTLEGTDGSDGRRRCTDLDLSGARFEDDITLRRITFEGNTVFDRCVFEGEARFEDCTFTGYVSFVNAKARRLACRECRFTHIVDLGHSRFADLSIRRSRFEAPVELELRRGEVDVHTTTFSGRSSLVGNPRSLVLRRVEFQAGARLRLDGSEVALNDVEFSAPSSLGFHLREQPALLGVAGSDVSRLTVHGTDLSRCTFAGADNLDGFGVDSLDAFPGAPRGPFTRRRVLWDEACLRAHDQRWGEVAKSSPLRMTPDQADASSERDMHLFVGYYGTMTTDSDVEPSPVEVASHYRALRKSREDAKDGPGAADFYYGEMEMRRMACRDGMRHAATWAEWATATTEHTLLWLYWAVSGYGLRAWRALTALLIVLLTASVIFRYGGFSGDTHTYAASLRFAVQSAMSLVRGTDEPLTPTGDWVALALRLLGPLLFGLALLALRGRVRR